MTDAVSVTTTTAITAIPEDINCLVRVRAQVMSRDDSSGGWVPLLGGGLSNVSVRKRITSAALIASTLTTTTAATVTTTTPNGSVDSNMSIVMPEKHDYVIDGYRISDQSIVLSCTMKKDFEYNKVMPTFHHWKTGDKRFGLTFQTAADARAFDKGVRTAFEDLLDDGNYSYVQLHAMHDYVYPSVATVVGTSLTSPHLSTKKHLDSTTTTSSSGVSTTTVIQQQPTPVSGKAPFEISSGFPFAEAPSGEQILRQHHYLCRYCHERFVPGSKNKTGSCEYAPDPFRVCINSVSCIRAAECVSYHCAADAEGELPQSPCACTCPGNGEVNDEHCIRRWLCVTLLSLFVPCLWLYPILNACHWCSVQCGMCGGRHAAMPIPISPVIHN